MKKVLKKKNKNILLIKSFIVILVLLLIGMLGYGFYRLTCKPYFSVNSRVDKLKEVQKKNPKYDILGWLIVQGTNIDFPIVYNDGDFPITSVFDEYAWMNNSELKGKNILSIFGHNIMNLSSKPEIASSEHTRFEQLPSFMYSDFAKNNKYIQFTTGDEDRIYKIFSVALVERDSLEPFNIKYNNRELNDYVKKAREDSFYDYDIDVNDSDEIISLTTCTRFNGQTNKYSLSITGRRLRESEKIKDYDMSEKDNYNKIKKKLRGVEKNEI